MGMRADVLLRLCPAVNLLGDFLSPFLWLVQRRWRGAAEAAFF